jgi:ubiquinone/menaquinone biosynthesis C-methylase UbiE
MNIFNMNGKWDESVTDMYDKVVAAGIDRLYDMLVDFLFPNLPAGSRCLDAGCGSGQIAYKVAVRNPGAGVTGIDLSERQIARASARGRGVPNLNFATGDAMRIEFEDNIFDTAYSVASIKHWPDRPAGISEMRRVCKPGGRVWVIEVNRGCTKKEARDFAYRWRVLPVYKPFAAWYFRRYVAGQGLDREELAAYLHKAGFKESYVQNVPQQPLLIGLGIK